MTAQLRIISLGWGVQSWTLAAMAALGEIPPVDFAVHADTTWEASGTYEHAGTWGPWLATHGVEVVTVQGKRDRCRAGGLVRFSVDSGFYQCPERPPRPGEAPMHPRLEDHAHP